jgi:hypothetical protein
MKILLNIILVGFCLITLSCSGKKDVPVQNISTPPKITREYLLAHGFKQLLYDLDIYESEKVHLKDVAHTLGFPLTALKIVPSRPNDQDVRAVELRDSEYIDYIEIKSIIPNVGETFYIPFNLLDDPNAMCTATVWLKYVPPRTLLQTESTPRISIKSVSVPKDRSQPLEVSFELAAIGKTPLAFSKTQFEIRISTEDAQSSLCGFATSFTKDTPEPIIVLPEKAITLKVTPQNLNFHNKLSDLEAGDYKLRINIAPARANHYDYQAVGQTYSEEYKFKLEKKED